MKSILRLKDVEVALGGKTILNIEELDVRPGEILAILGPTGSGKSTTLKLMAFLIKPKKGELFWQGKTVRFPAPLVVRRSISMTFQDPLPFEGTVFENVAYGLRIRGIKGKELGTRVEEALELFSISHLKNQSARKVSGGEAQRVALARSLVFRPSLLLLDEPLASLDPITKEGMIPELHKVLKQLGITCVYVTHDQEEAFALADRIAVMEQGEIIQVGTKEDVFFKPGDVRVARFVGAENLIPAVILSNEEYDVQNWYKNHLLIENFLQNKKCNWIWNGGWVVEEDFKFQNRFDGDYWDFIDFGADDTHPGPKHNKLYSEKLYQYITENHKNYLP